MPATRLAAHLRRCCSWSLRRIPRPPSIGANPGPSRRTALRRRRTAMNMPGACSSRSIGPPIRRHVSRIGRRDSGTRSAGGVGVLAECGGCLFEQWREIPGPGLQAARDRPVAPERRFETLSLRDLPNAKHIVGGVMVPLVDSISDAKRLTEVRMNRAAFEYIRARELYSLEGQLRVYAAGATVSFPYGAREIKAKWRPISAGESSPLSHDAGDAPRWHAAAVRPDGAAHRLEGSAELVLGDLRTCRQPGAARQRGLAVAVEGSNFPAAVIPPTAIGCPADWVSRALYGSTTGCAAR